MVTSFGDRVSRGLEASFGFLLFSPLFFILLVTTLACFGHDKPVLKQVTLEPIQRYSTDMPLHTRTIHKYVS